ncbi:hypothetical protein A2690_01085 [Candidatus Roizmanbacteria bacterium RIFCSPHIGHO2_01_FULL_39_12b]|uniref:Uncharacterized protein n=1 Tax=Candidatus Roizmanbacteria bacterium RIFCSPHIGHO2_01_FULL_39_12b TaxID=1802030 RepID=A0A1F7GE00_9BACT|nr:MAG: hypothetical protein A2690_01085 [Candidatus Roizmanbacteria bacterium RIFCSPHIGHO2_01_FULL_39_12b]
MRFTSQILSLVFAKTEDDDRGISGLVNDLIRDIDYDVIATEQMDQEGNKFRLVDCDYPFIIEKRGLEVALLAEVTLGESLISKDILLRGIFRAIERQIARNRVEVEFNKWFTSC